MTITPNVVGASLLFVAATAYVLGSLGSKYPNRTLNMMCAVAAFGIVFVLPAVWLLAAYFPENW